MIIDVHNHPDWVGHDLDKVLANIEKYHIDKTWLLTWEAPLYDYDPEYLRLNTPGFGEYPTPFCRCLSYVERAPEKFILGYAPDPRLPESIGRLAAAIDIYHVRVFGELKLRMMYDNPDAIRMFRFCGKKCLPVLVHIDYEFDTGVTFPRPSYWYGGGIDSFERAVQLCPETNFIGHAPGFWSHISGDDQFDKDPYCPNKVVAGGKVIEMLRKYPNLYGDLSADSGWNALHRDPEFAKQFLTEFQDRILYGRDDFSNKLQDFLNSLDLPQSILDKIYFGNAFRLIPFKI